jgi:hypothetical protein
MRACYLPATAWAVACAKPEQRRGVAYGAWNGGRNSMGERERDRYAALLLRGRDWIAEDDTWQAFETLALALYALVAAEAAA